MIQFSHVQFHYKRKQGLVLEDFSLVLGGEPTLLLGRNGSGKSTLLKLAAGLERATGGDISSDGKALYLPQNFVSVPGLSVRSYVSHLAWLAGQDRTTARRDADKWIKAVGLKGREDASNRELSGGQQSRLALAYALNSGAATILMDEPGAALDPVSKRDLHDLYRVVVGSGKGLIVASHDPTDLEGPFERIVLIDSGEAIYDGSVDEFLSRSHENPIVDSFARAMRRPDGS